MRASGLPRDLRASCGTQVDLAARAPARARRRARATASASGRRTATSGSSTQFATARVGAILVTINPAYKAAELEYALDKAGVSLLVMARGFRAADYVAHARRGARRCPALREAIVLEDDWDGVPGRRRRASATRELAEREATLQFDDPINIQYTSGTTGSPKGATLSHHNILNNALLHRAHAALHRARPRLRAGAVLPLLRHGASATWPASRTARAWWCPGEAFDPLPCSRRSRPSAARRSTACRRCSSPSSSIRDFARFDLSSLRTGIMAGAPCPVEVMKQVRTRMHMGEVTIVCGMTETSPVSTQTALDDPLDKRVGTVGRVHPHVEIKIVDPATGAIVPRGTPGEQCTRGYSVMLGYWDDDAATARGDRRRRLDAHRRPRRRWTTTATCSIVGRIKDMIIRGGENIYPREIEEFLHTASPRSATPR